MHKLVPTIEVIHRHVPTQDRSDIAGIPAMSVASAILPSCPWT